MTPLTKINRGKVKKFLIQFLKNLNKLWLVFHHRFINRMFCYRVVVKELPPTRHIWMVYLPLFYCLQVNKLYRNNLSDHVTLKIWFLNRCCIIIDKNWTSEPDEIQPRWKYFHRDHPEWVIPAIRSSENIQELNWLQRI